MSRWLLVRHGETEWNRDGKAQGHSDITLSERGRDQARALHRALRNIPIHAVATSDLTRAKETAKLVLGERDVPFHVTPDLREANYGEWEGLTSDEAKARDPDLHAKWLLWDPSFVAPGGESVDEIMIRVKRFLKTQSDLAEDKTLLVVSHGGTLRLLFIALMAMPIDTFRQFVLDNASLSIVDVWPQRGVLSLWNDTSHYQKTD